MPEYNDGAVPYGFGFTATVVLSPASSGVVLGNYVLESLTLDVGGFQIERRNGANVMSGRVAGDDSDSGNSVAQAVTGTATLQRATSSTAAPKVGNGLLLDAAVPINPFSSRVFVITGVTHNYGQAEAHTFSVNFAGTSGEI